jgi:hypothetical protein
LSAEFASEARSAPSPRSSRGEGRGEGLSPRAVLLEKAHHPPGFAVLRRTTLYGAFFVKRWLYHIVHFLPQLLRRRCPSTGRRRSITKIRRRRPVEGQRKTVLGEPARSGDDRRHNLVFGGALCGLRTMMQSYASAARLLGGRTHSLPRHCSHGRLRVTAYLGLSWHCITPINAKPVFDGSFG